MLFSISSGQETGNLFGVALLYNYYGNMHARVSVSGIIWWVVPITQIHSGHLSVIASGHLSHDYEHM